MNTLSGMSLSRSPFNFVQCQRRYRSNFSAVEEWASTTPRLILNDTLRPEHLQSLYATLPTRNGHTRPSNQPTVSQELGYGHHLVFFHPRNPEHVLRPDGTDADFCPPEPFTRRMWAGGKFTWDNSNPLRIGDDAVAKASVKSVQVKGKDSEFPLVFVNQLLEISAGKTTPSVVEERVHVYLAESANRNKVIRQVTVPQTCDFSFKYKPTPTTLFRFSALTFNGHHIHLDKEYAQNVEGYPERLVHGPLTALMLLEAATFQNPKLKLNSMEYQAQNALVVDKSLGIYGAWVNESRISMWCQDEQSGVVGMTGTLLVETR
ncbi:hypothetical protein BDN72DRAFT_830968 [Pluteus cervinus]|uniref:Uncharacterized protein n=1 Tax=Pluteus cervinus TaxID=181527 RepID=A0ACD3BF10_9AGAR|nr:hypothetical protein BDN72DRAFT_830968 [Pluteus cervinus]